MHRWMHLSLTLAKRRSLWKPAAVTICLKIFLQRLLLGITFTSLVTEIITSFSGCPPQQLISTVKTPNTESTLPQRTSGHRCFNRAAARHLMADQWSQCGILEIHLGGQKRDSFQRRRRMARSVFLRMIPDLSELPISITQRDLKNLMLPFYRYWTAYVAEYQSIGEKRREAGLICVGTKSRTRVSYRRKCFYEL